MAAPAASGVIGVYGSPPLALAPPKQGAKQFSPFTVGAGALEDLKPGDLSEITLLAPPGTIERRYVLALALRALAPGGRLTAMAPKDKGGSRIKGELEAFGAPVNESSKAHHRISVVIRPETLDDAALAAAITEGAPRLVEGLGLWSQPGVFSWNRLDPGSALLAETLPALSGKGADFGCGVGYLAHTVLASPAVTHLTLIDLDRRAIEAAKRNVNDPRAEIVWADVRAHDLTGLDFVVMNPPFHDGGSEDKALGQAFIQRAHGALKSGGVLWIVANRHLPYEQVLTKAFKSAPLEAQTGAFKVYGARK